MRRPRHKLQVSTFPFLAVLLCAMGALILFLLVMDCRAKMVARHKAEETLAMRRAAHEDEDAERKAQWERQREALHQVLLAERAELDGEAQQTAKKIADASQALATRRAEHDALETTARKEAVRLAQYREHLKTKESQLKDGDRTSAAANAGLARLSREVADLEMVLGELKALKAREHHTYSLVPYHGKRGDTRKPVYIECAGSAIIIHPDRAVLDGLDFNAASLRAEVECRAGKLEREVKTKSKEPESGPPRGPYVLFLVRPDGISSYYHAMGLLRGFQIDFGYEMIDQHWALDFANDLPPGTQPWDGKGRTPVSTVKPQPFPPAPSPLPLPAPAPSGPEPVPVGGSGLGYPGARAGVGGPSGARGSPFMGAPGPYTPGGIPSANAQPGGTSVGTGVPGPFTPGGGASGAGAQVNGGPGPFTPGGGASGAGGAQGIPGVAGLGGVGGPQPMARAGSAIGSLGGPAGVSGGSGAGGSPFPGAPGPYTPGGMPSANGQPGGASPSTGIPGPLTPGSGVQGAGGAPGIGAPGPYPAGGGAGASGGTATGIPGVAGSGGTSVGYRGGSGIGGVGAAGQPFAGAGGRGPQTGAAPATQGTGSPTPSAGGAGVANGQPAPPPGPLAAALGIPNTGVGSGGAGGSAGGGGCSGSGGSASGGGSSGTNSGGSDGGSGGASGSGASSQAGGAKSAPGQAGASSGGGVGMPSFTIPGTNITVSAGSKGGGGGGPSGNPSGQGPQPDAPGSSGKRTMGVSGGSMDESGSAGGDGGPSGLPGPSLPPVPGPPNGKPRPSPSPLAHALGNRDFLITIACYADHVTTYPGGRQHSWKNANRNAIEEMAVKDVQGLIAGRQRSVRPGDPPYRPLIRFQVAPDGLGTYLHLYPRLEILHVPMTRESLDE